MRSVKHEYDYNEIDHLPLQTYLFGDTGKYIFKPAKAAVEAENYKPYPIESLPESYRERLLREGKCPIWDRRLTETGLAIAGVLGYLHLYHGGLF